MLCILVLKIFALIVPIILFFILKFYLYLKMIKEAKLFFFKFNNGIEKKCELAQFLNGHDSHGHTCILYKNIFYFAAQLAIFGL